jgi:hypothetical protein
VRLCRAKCYSYLRLGVGQEGGVFAGFVPLIFGVTMSLRFCFHLFSPWNLLKSFIVQVSSNDLASLGFR